MENRKLLIIVDPQIDFISGTLPVPHAKSAMLSLAEDLNAKANGMDGYFAIAITADWHPWNHSSFAEYGGPWPAHCVAFSPGAAIFEPVLASAHHYCAPAGVHILTKGTETHKEEYSIMQNPPSAKRLHEIISSLGISQIDICGLAGDICVQSTYADMSQQYDNCRVLEKYSPRIQP